MPAKKQPSKPRTAAKKKAGRGCSGATCSASSWNDWPKKTGQQFIHHLGETWVGNVQQTKQRDDTRIIIWKGSAYFTIFASRYSGGFHFAEIVWPDSPQNSD
jgi:hypothetical protein